SPLERVSTPTSPGRRPVTCAICPARCGSSSANAAPTVPWPSRPILKAPPLDVTGGEVVVGLAAHDDAGVAVPAEDHRRPRDAVVVVRHRVAIGAGPGRHEHVARLRGLQRHVAYDHIARLAVLAGDM